MMAAISSLRFTRFQIEGRSCCGNLLWKIKGVDIDSDSDDNVADGIQIGTHLCQDAADLFTGKHQVIGPLNLTLHACDILDSGGHCHGCHQCQHGCVFRSHLGL